MTPQNGPENHARRLMILFAAVYVAEGLGQMGGVINQGLTLYLLNDQHWTSTQIASFLSILSFPWLIKPLYGIVSDFVPLFGYKRKLYLVIANALAVGGYLSITTMTSPSHIGIALVVTAFGMAISSTLCGAVLVENGKKSGLNGQFVSQQWLWFYIANICAAFIAGQLCQYLPPGTAMHISAFIAATALFGVMIACWFLTNEERAPVNINGLKESLASLWRALRSRTMWIIGVFIFAYYFSPGFGTPLFVHMNLRPAFQSTVHRESGFGCSFRSHHRSCDFSLAGCSTVVETHCICQHFSRCSLASIVHYARRLHKCSCAKPHKRHVQHGGGDFNLHASGRLLPGWFRGIHIRSVDVDAQCGFALVLIHRRVPL